MSRNLFVCYDLRKSNRDYEAVAKAIKSLGSWAQVQQSIWYGSSNLDAAKAAEVVWGKMDNNDSLIVVDATESNASWYNLSPDVSRFIRDHWSS